MIEDGRSGYDREIAHCVNLNTLSFFFGVFYYAAPLLSVSCSGPGGI